MRSSPIESKCFGVVLAALLGLLSISEASAQVLWYNGIDNGVDSFFSSDSTASTGYSGTVYDDFTITSTGDSQITGVYGNFLAFDATTNDFLSSVNISNANWTILSGVTASNGGTLVQSGTGAATVVAGEDSFGHTLYNVSVTGLSINLQPGTYWLGLQPITSDSAYVDLVTTSGANAIGTPPGNDGKAFFSDNSGDKFLSATTGAGATPDDFSLGVDGSAVPEPSSWALTLIGVGLLACLRARSRQA